MHGTYSRLIRSELEQQGRKALIEKHGTTGKNEWGNPTQDYTEGSFITAFRTYPNRNTEVKNAAGEWSRNSPIILTPVGGGVPELERSDRLYFPTSASAAATLSESDAPGEIDGVVHYELTAPTHYETHTEWTAEQVLNE
jgi:hypothetical protein